MRLGTRVLVGAWLCAGVLAVGAWADETPAAQPDDAPDPAHGKQIFETICSHCHFATHETSPVGAPGLLDVTKRRSVEWIDQWLQGPEAFSKKDPTAKKLVESNPIGFIMPTLPEMQDPKNRRDVIEFLKTLRSP